MSVKAWQYTGDGEPLALRDVEEPVAQAGEVLLDVVTAGICHSDVTKLDGSTSSVLKMKPITLGHEIAGVVSALGEGVTGYAVGDPVVIRADLNGPGLASNGGFQPKLAVSADLLVPVPEGVPWDQAAVSTDAGITSFHAVVVRGNAKAGTKVGIIGFGGLGSLGAQAALGVGADVYVSEINERLHDYARELGVTAVGTDIAAFSDIGLDLIVDFSGSNTTAAAVETVKPRGRVVQVGFAVPQGTVNLLRLTIDEVELVGSCGGTNADNAHVLRLVAEGKIASRTTIIDFDHIPDAIGKLARHEVTGRQVVLYG
jgi:D-arabinose 1-dehydrogenase-like Zn-dependent alcohol dehydrogenase